MKTSNFLLIASSKQSFQEKKKQDTTYENIPDS